MLLNFFKKWETNDNQINYVTPNANSS